MKNKYEEMTKEELGILQSELISEFKKLELNFSKERGLLKYHANKKLEKVIAELNKRG